MKRRRTYPKEFKEEDIRLVEEEGLSCHQQKLIMGLEYVLSPAG